MKTVLAILALGLCLMLASCSTPVPKDMPSLKVLAEKGDQVAQYNLGVMYRDHPESKTLSHVLKDDAEAAKWFRKSALQGYAEAQYALGQKYAYGVGKDEKEEAAKWFRKAAEQGFVGAQKNLGLMYYQGKGVPQDNREAAKWYRKAAEQGDAEAQFELGKMYRKGKGVAEDDHEAVRWFRKAAVQGDAHAQYFLGVMYADGEGVPKDDVTAHAWWSIAANGLRRSRGLRTYSPRQ